MEQRHAVWIQNKKDAARTQFDLQTKHPLLMKNGVEKNQEWIARQMAIARAQSNKMRLRTEGLYGTELVAEAVLTTQPANANELLNSPTKAPQRLQNARQNQMRSPDALDCMRTGKDARVCPTR